MEIVVRAALLFGFLWLITRVVGRSTLGELSTFQLLLYVTMGDLVQQSITQQDYSMTSGVLAVGVFALLTVLLSWINSRWPGSRSVIHGIPVVIIKDGEPLLDVLRPGTPVGQRRVRRRAGERASPTGRGRARRAGGRREDLLLHRLRQRQRRPGAAAGRVSLERPGGRESRWARSD